jgi:hypothetical protein
MQRNACGKSMLAAFACLQVCAGLQIFTGLQGFCEQFAICDSSIFLHELAGFLFLSLWSLKRGLKLRFARTRLRWT